MKGAKNKKDPLFVYKNAVRRPEDRHNTRKPQHTRATTRNRPLGPTTFELRYTRAVINATSAHATGPKTKRRIFALPPWNLAITATFSGGGGYGPPVHHFPIGIDQKVPFANQSGHHRGKP